MNFCLNPKFAQAFKGKVEDGTINTSEMAQMSSEDRRKLLEGIVGPENAREVNASFESKLILQDVQAGLNRWVDSLTKVKPDVKADLASRIEKMDPILNPADRESFLKDLASTKLGVDVTAEEAKNISDLSNKVTESKTSVDEAVAKDGFTDATKEARLKLGADKVILQDYVGELKKGSNTITISDRLKPGNWNRTVSDLLGATKGIVSSLSSHAPLKHGFPALFEDPIHWLKNYATQFSDAFKSLKGEDAMAAVKAEGYSRENSINGIYDKWIPGELSKVNEEYYSDLPSKIPLAGRLFKASKDMFNGFNLKMRMDMVDHYVKTVERMGLDPNDPEIAKSWGKLAIDQTGGTSKEGTDVGNKFLFSERLLRAEGQNLTAHIFDKSLSTAAKVQSAKTLAKMVIGVGSAIAIANTLHPGSAEVDPRSANFGTIKIGNTRYDISGGMKGLFTLATRLAYAVQGKPAIKSSTSGKISNIGVGFGQTSYAELIGDFLQGRSSPIGQVIADLANQQTFGGEKPTIASELGAMITPIPVSTYESLASDPSAHVLGTMIAQQLGLMSTTYGSAGPQYSDKVNSEFSRISSKGYSVSLSKPDNLKLFTDLKTQKGEEVYTEAIDKYNSELSTRVNNLVSSADWSSLPIGASDPTRTAPRNTKLGEISNIEKMLQNEFKAQYGVNTKLDPITPSSDR